MATKKEVFETLAKKYIAKRLAEMNGYCVKDSDEACPDDCRAHHKEVANRLYRELCEEYEKAE